MADKQSADKEPLIAREHAENAFRDALCLFVGRGRRYKVDQLAKASGVPKRLIECYRSYVPGHPDHRKLHFGFKLSIASVLGADFTNEWLPLAGQGAFDLPDGDGDAGTFAADNSDDNADITRKALSGTFEDDCPRQVSELGSRMMTRGAHLVAVGRRVAG